MAPQKKWTNADLSGISKYGGVNTQDFEEEPQLNTEGFEPLPNVDLTNKPPVRTPYTGDPNRQRPENLPDSENTVLTGVSKFANKMYNQVANVGKEGVKHIKEGNYPAAFHDVTAPITDAFGPGAIDAVRNYFGGNRPSREQSAVGLSEMAGIPTGDILEDIKAGRYYSAAGGALGTAAMFAGPHYFNKFGHPSVEPGLKPEPVVEPPAPPVEPQQPNLRFDYGPHQPDLFEEKPGWTGAAKQAMLSPPNEPFTSSATQQDLGIVNRPPNLPHEFSPDQNYLPDTQLPQPSAFAKLENAPPIEPENKPPSLFDRIKEPVKPPVVEDPGMHEFAPVDDIMGQLGESVKRDESRATEEPSYSKVEKGDFGPNKPITRKMVEDKDYEKLWNNPDEASFEGAMDRHIEDIHKELDPEVVKDNYNNWQQEYEHAKIHGTPDDIETAGTLRDHALDKYRKTFKKEPDWGVTKPGSPHSGRNIDEEPTYSRKWSPSVGADNVGGKFEEIISEAPLETLHEYKSTLENDLIQAQKEVGKYPSGELNGRTKRTVLAIQKKLDRINNEIQNKEEVPLFGKSDKGGIKITADVSHAAKELTTGYTRDLPGIMVREAYQNAKDAIHGMGDKGRIHANIEDDGFTLSDNGKGMDRGDLETVFSTLHSSGKTNDPNATGGKGIGKATYMLGGQHFSITSVKEVDGQKILTTMEGTPADLMEHVDVNETVVPYDTPTGTSITTKFSEDQVNSGYAGANARNMYRDIQNHSRDLQGRHSRHVIKEGKEFDPIKSTKNDQLVGHTDIEGNSVGVYIPHDAVLGEQSYLDYHVLNNGMYQYSDSVYLGEKVPDMPSKVIVNISPSAKEMSPEYPFPTQRESLKDNVAKELQNYLRKQLIEPTIEKGKNVTQELYDSMSQVAKPIPGAARKSLIFDPGKRFTDQELKIVSGNQVLQKVNKLFDKIVNEALKATGRTGPESWGDRLEGVGTMFSEPGFYGVHVPNPNSGKSSIMINFLNHIEEHADDPKQAAYETIVTLFHELGHIGKKEYLIPDSAVGIAQEHMKDPRLGELMNMYLENVSHGAKTQNQGHAADWLARTAEVMNKYGPSKTLGAVDELHNIFTEGVKHDPNSPVTEFSGYNGQAKSLLQLAQERRGRPETTKDYLSPTGIKSESAGGRKGNTEGGINADTVRTTTERPTNSELTEEFNKPIKWSAAVKPPENAPVSAAVVKQIRQKGNVDKLIQQGGEALKAAKNDNTTPRDEKEGYISKALNFQRTVLTSADLSAPGRQGLPLIGRKEWWSSWKPMFEALGSDKGYELVMDSIKNDPSGLFAEGAKGKSFANEAKLALTDTLDHREELFRSKWAEDFAGTKWFVKPSVRAYTAYLNKLRADTFKNMVKEAGAENDLVTAKKIADYINVATGRGNLGAFEGAAKPLAQIFFSPRLTASRLQMYTRTFNPKFYVDMPPVVRKNQLRSMLAMASTGLVIGQLAKGIGATVNLDDPDSTDFGKIRFGNTRIDPFGGEQQFLVAAARIAMGSSTSSTSGKTSSLTSGKFGKSTRASVFGNFMKNKLAPVPAFVWSWMDGKEYDGTPFSVKQELVNKTAPIVTQDLYDIWKDNPELLPGLFASGSAFVGGGVQTYGR